MKPYKAVKKILFDYLNDCDSADMEQFTGLMNLSEKGRKCYLDDMESDLEKEDLGDAKALIVIFGKEEAREYFKESYEKACFVCELLDTIKESALETMLLEWLGDDQDD